MASKRHRQVTAPPRKDKMGIAHRHRIERTRVRELDTEITGSTVRTIRCGSCETSFAAAEINPTCPNCGAILSLRRPR